jgi:hypothetical protein
MPEEMPDDTAGVRYRGFGAKIGDFASAFARAARKADVLLVGHINLMPFAALYKVLRPRGKVILFAHGIEIWNDPRYRKAGSMNLRCCHGLLTRLRWSVGTAKG